MTIYKARYEATTEKGGEVGGGFKIYAASINYWIHNGDSLFTKRHIGRFNCAILYICY